MGSGEVAPVDMRRRVVRGIIATCLLCLLAVLLLARSCEPRQSAVRTVIHSRLRTVAQAAEIYMKTTGVTPTLDDLLAAGHIDPTVLRDFSRAHPQTPPSDGAWDGPLLVQTVPCRAVRKGEAWGGPGEFTDRDLPACRFVLMHGWTVVEMDEPEYQREYAGRVRLTPLK